MKEIKKTKSKKCVDWFTSHIVVIAVVAFAIGLFLSSCNYAKAEVVNYDTLDDYFYNDIQYHDSTFDDYYEQYKTENEYFYTCEWERSGTTYIQIFFTNYNGLTCSSFKSRQNAAYTMAYGGELLYLYNIDSVPVGSRVYCVSGAKNSNHYCVSYAQTTELPFSTTNYAGYTGIGCRYSFTRVYNTNVYLENPSTPVFKYVKGDFNFYYNYSNHILENNFTTYVSDTRLQFATWSDSIGRSILHVDMTDYLNSTGFNISNTTLNDFTLSIEYTVKDTDDIETHTISYNNSSEYFTEYGENGKLTRIYMNIPYKEFYGFSYEDNSFPDYDDVIIQNAIVNLDLVPVGGNTSINITSYVDCLYYLQHIYDEISPEDLPLPEYEDTFVQDAQDLIDSINELHAGSSFYTDGDFTFSSPIALPEWADIWEYDLTYATIGSDNEFLGDFYPYPYDINDGNVRQDVNDIIYEFTDEKYGYYDVVRIRVFRARINSDFDVSVTYLDTVYIYLYTERYFMRKDALTNIDILKMLQQSATNDVSFFESIRDRVDDFEEKTLVAITGNDNSIFSYINDLDKDLNSGISRIIDSMPVFNWTPFNDDDILNALYTIVANQNSPHDGYARYISWVKDEQTSGGFGKWANDMFDVFHDAYDFFNYQDDINPNETGLQQYIDYVKLYMQYLTQGDEGILPAQSVYYKGIFDNTYDLHNVNGRSG